MEENFTIEVLCLFCHSTLTADEDMEFESGDLIKCNSCGEMNDYDSVVEVAKEKAVEKVKTEVEEELSKTFNNLFK
ncbi:hypothetical protein MNBD_GAMMA08-3 [hydrothermal vent metagenome]|uniref:Uncharacterized protein n=1 Tax=hydrothermal vent metagenome TaxID=652676 RepID=A0A3B0X947_9ZZZZ